MKAAVMFKRIGPYHRARLNAAAQEMDVVGIEFSSADKVYAWDLAEGGDFPRFTLFKDADVATKSQREIARQLRSALAVTRPDVIAIPGWSSPSALTALSLGVDGKIPLVMMSDTTIYDAPRRYWQERVKRRIVGLCGAALVAGAPHAAYLAGLGVKPERIFLGYDVVDNEHFSNGADSSRLNDSNLRKKYSLPRRYFLVSSRFIGKKNLFVLIEAYARYRQDAGDSACGLVILGDGDLRASLVEQISALGVREAVCLPGFVQYDELPVYYGLAEAFIHASIVEQWGLVVNEAMAAGLPVIVSEGCGCATDLVEHGRNGYLFNPRDGGALSRCMAGMMSEGCDRKAMGRRSRGIIAHWNLDRFAHGLDAAARAALMIPPERTSVLDRLLLQMLARRPASGAASGQPERQIISRSRQI